MSDPYTLPTWFTSADGLDSATANVVSVVTKHLITTDPDSILATAKLLITAEDLYNCDLTFLYTLYKLLQYKKVVIAVQTESEDEYPINLVLLKTIFPKE